MEQANVTPLSQSLQHPKVLKTPLVYTRAIGPDTLSCFHCSMSNFIHSQPYSMFPLPQPQQKPKSLPLTHTSILFSTFIHFLRTQIPYLNIPTVESSSLHQAWPNVLFLLVHIPVHFQISCSPSWGAINRYISGEFTMCKLPTYKNIVNCKDTQR